MKTGPGSNNTGLMQQDAQVAGEVAVHLDTTWHGWGQAPSLLLVASVLSQQILQREDRPCASSVCSGSPAEWGFADIGRCFSIRDSVSSTVDLYFRTIRRRPRHTCSEVGSRQPLWPVFRRPAAFNAVSVATCLYLVLAEAVGLGFVAAAAAEKGAADATALSASLS